MYHSTISTRLNILLDWVMYLNGRIKIFNKCSWISIISAVLVVYTCIRIILYIEKNPIKNDQRIQTSILSKVETSKRDSPEVHLLVLATSRFYELYKKPISTVRCYAEKYGYHFHEGFYKLSIVYVWRTSVGTCFM